MARGTGIWEPGVLGLNVLAVDLGAGSGRVVLGQFDGDALTLREVHRFTNDPVVFGPHLHWDFLRLLHEVKRGLGRGMSVASQDVASFGLDTWAVDFGLLDASGELLGNPYHYRDEQTIGVVERLSGPLSPDRLYAHTGIQLQSFNTLIQLFALRQRGCASLTAAQSLMLMPDLFRYALTGERLTEYTSACATQLFNPALGGWDPQLLSALGLPGSLLAPVVSPGVQVAKLTEPVAREIGETRLVMCTVGEHDTASAVVAVPTQDEEFVYLSSGTWSLMGTEVTAPVLTETARALNFTNEGGVNGRWRFQKNIMGLWILQECVRRWQTSSPSIDVGSAVALAAQARPMAHWIDVDAIDFFAPKDMPKAIVLYCQRTGQAVPDGIGPMVRCILESLAYRYREVYDEIERAAERSCVGLHVVGGGSRNALLCQWTADALQQPVWAGPAESTAAGNVVMQLIAHGELTDVREARAMIERSMPRTLYTPNDAAQWRDGFECYSRTMRQSRR